MQESLCSPTEFLALQANFVSLDFTTVRDRNEETPMEETLKKWVSLTSDNGESGEEGKGRTLARISFPAGVVSPLTTDFDVMVA